MRINQGELAELLEDEIGDAKVYFNDDTGTMRVQLVFMSHDEYSTVVLEHMTSDQLYCVIHSTSPDMFPGNTISVDEILDIVL